MLVVALQTRDPYVGLGAALPGSEWALVREYVAKGMAARPPAFVPAGATPLEAGRAAARHYASLLNGLHTLREAPYVPASPFGASDLAAVERLQELVALAAHVRFADGERHEAVAHLLDGLTMALRVQSEPAEMTVETAFVRDREAIPLPECERVRTSVDDFLAASPAGESRTRLFRLRLRMRIEAYRWRFGKAPERLSDAAPSAETLDPRSHEPFSYERVGNDYRLDELLSFVPGAGKPCVGSRHAGTLMD